MIKRVLNKWQFGIDIDKNKAVDPFVRMGWWRFHVYCLKINSFPDSGFVLEKGHYKGWRLMFNFWIPFEKEY